MDPGLNLPGSPAPVTACDGTAGPPGNLIPIYIQAAKRFGLGARGPQILAAINKVETDFGRLNQVTSYAGAIGWMQFMPATWDSYGIDGDGDGKDDPYNPRDAIHSAANYLSAAGAPGDWYDAIWAYNHADWYVNDVLEKAACYGALEDTTEVDDGIATFVCKPNLSRSREIPNYLMRAFEDAASRYELGQRGIWALAAVARLESDYGRGMTRAEQADTGVMGFSRSEWKRYGVDGDGDGLVRRGEAWDAIASFARLLWSKPSIRAGLFEHNHAAWYVEATMRDAKQIAGECDRSKATWNIAYPAPATAVTEINWSNLQILNPSAQADIQNGMIDPRVVNLLAILTRNHTLQVSSLRSDHGMMTSSGNVSNHYFGRAVDIAAVDGVSCTDMSPEGPCATVGRLLTLLPEGARPTELIYGFDLDGDGPAFAMADHRDHIHAGFGP
ncbi:MAG: lytic murein transglycosylase [Thermoleophilia bacterium]|nr:lytic murein transglycosylase [Thermoleophilia bacterium]